jgi:hypothetical protein
MKLPQRRLLHLSRMTITIGFAIALASSTASDAAEIKVLTSRAMNHALTELAVAFERTSEHKVAIILAPPAEISRRIISGEIVDVAMTASGNIGHLVQQGRPRQHAAPSPCRYWRGSSRRIGKAGHRLCRSLQARPLGRQIDRLYGPGSRRSEWNPFREDSRSPGYPQIIGPQ